MIQHLENCRCLRYYFEQLGAALGSNKVDEGPALSHLAVVSLHGQVGAGCGHRAAAFLVVSWLFSPTMALQLITDTSSPCQNDPTQFPFPCPQPFPMDLLTLGTHRERAVEPSEEQQAVLLSGHNHFARGRSLSPGGWKDKLVLV